MAVPAVMKVQVQNLAKWTTMGSHWAKEGEDERVCTVTLRGG